MQPLRIDPGFRALLPALSPEELKLLATNLRTDGCREPLVVWASGEYDEPTILDGHNRFEICTRLGIEFEIVEVENCLTHEAAITWIVANQLGRRNLTPSQKGPLGIELKKQLAAEARKRQGQRTDLREIVPGSGDSIQRFRCPYCSNSYTKPPGHICKEMGKASDKAAKLLGINPHYITDSEKIEQDAPELLEQVKQGKLSIPQAKKVAALPAEDRPAAIERIHKKEPDAEGGWIYRDGKLVAVHTNTEVEVWSQRSRQVIDAIAALGTVDLSPEDYLRAFQPSYADTIDEHLSAAIRWLEHFTKCWEARHAQAV